MKKVILSVTAIMAFGVASAQKVKFAAKTGINISSIKASTSNGDSKSLVGFHIGGLAEIKLNDKMSLQPELLYSAEGGKYSFAENIEGTPITYNQEIKLSKMNLPISFKYYIIERLSIEAGPQLEYILSAKSESVLNAPTEGVIIANNTDLSNDSSIVTFNGFPDVSYQDYGLKKLNFSFNLGSGYELPMGVFFQARYSLGLTKFVDNANFMAGKDADGDQIIDNRYDNTSFKSSNFQLSVGYKF